MENLKFNQLGEFVAKNGTLMKLTTTPEQMYNFLLKLKERTNKELIEEYIEMFRSYAPFFDEEEEFLDTLKKNSGF